MLPLLVTYITSRPSTRKLYIALKLQNVNGFTYNYPWITPKYCMNAVYMYVQYVRTIYILYTVVELWILVGTRIAPPRSDRYFEQIVYEADLPV